MPPELCDQWQLAQAFSVTVVYAELGQGSGGVAFQVAIELLCVLAVQYVLSWQLLQIAEDWVVATRKSVKMFLCGSWQEVHCTLVFINATGGTIAGGSSNCPSATDKGASYTKDTGWSSLRSVEKLVGPNGMVVTGVKSISTGSL